MHPGRRRLSRHPLLLYRLRPLLRVLRKIAGESIGYCKRTLRLGPQGRELDLTPKEVVLRGAPFPSAEMRVTEKTPLGCITER